MTKDIYVIPIAGYRVTAQRTTSDVTLTLKRDSDDAELSFAPEAATVVRPDGSTQPYDGLEWLGAVVTDAEASSSYLTVRFHDMNALHVAPVSDIESWQVVTPEGLFVASPV